MQKTLTVIQFTVSLVFVIFLVSIYQQTKFLTSFSYGFSQKNILIIPLPDQEKNVYKIEIANIAGVEKVASASSFFGFNPSYHSIIKNHSGEEGIESDVYYIDENIIPVMGLQLIAGNNFIQSARSNDNKIIINEKAVKSFGFATPQDAIGKPSIINDTLHVIIAGVVKDFNYMNPKLRIWNLVMQYNPEQSKYLIAKVSTLNKDAVPPLVQDVIKRVDPNTKITATWLHDELTDPSRKPEELPIIAFLAFMAITIACIGLLGITTYAVSVRQKEVGIRKVLGANVKSIVYLLSKDFVWLLLIASTVSLPIGYVLGNSFLNEFAYRINLGWEILATGVLMTLLLGLATISSQTIKVATANPVKSLRTE